MKNMRRIRKELGFSIKRLAEDADIAPSYIFNLETGNRTNPSREVMEKIALAFGKSVAEVFFEDDFAKKVNKHC